MALDTVEDYVAAARTLLQDEQAGAYRYSDTELVRALSFAMLEARKLRPDLFIGRTTPSYTANDTTAVVMDEQYRVPFVYYICGHAQLRDNESTEDLRAMTFIGKFQSMLLSLT